MLERVLKLDRFSQLPSELLRLIFEYLAKEEGDLAIVKKRMISRRIKRTIDANLCAPESLIWMLGRFISRNRLQLAPEQHPSKQFDKFLFYFRGTKEYSDLSQEVVNHDKQLQTSFNITLQPKEWLKLFCYKLATEHPVPFISALKYDVTNAELILKILSKLDAYAAKGLLNVFTIEDEFNTKRSFRMAMACSLLQADPNTLIEIREIYLWILDFLFESISSEDYPSNETINKFILKNFPRLCEENKNDKDLIEFFDNVEAMLLIKLEFLSASKKQNQQNELVAALKKIHNNKLFRSHFAIALTNANLSDVNLDHLQLKFTNLTSCNLSGARLAQVSFYNADLTGANLQSARMIDVVLASANITGVNLSYVDFRYVCFYSLSFDFRDADLSYANFSHLSGEELTLMNITQATCIGLRIFKKLAFDNLQRELDKKIELLQAKKNPINHKWRQIAAENVVNDAFAMEDPADGIRLIMMALSHANFTWPRRLVSFFDARKAVCKHVQKIFNDGIQALENKIPKTLPCEKSLGMR